MAISPKLQALIDAVPDTRQWGIKPKLVTEGGVVVGDANVRVSCRDRNWRNAEGHSWVEVRRETKRGP